MKHSMIYQKIDEKEAKELKKFYKRFFDKRIDIMKKTQPKVDGVFGDFLGKRPFSPEQKKLFTFISQNNVNFIISIEKFFLKLERKE